VDGHAVALQDGAVAAVDQEFEVECRTGLEKRGATLELDRARAAGRGDDVRDGVELGVGANPVD
jgi:hypothetical protein